MQTRALTVESASFPEFRRRRKLGPGAGLGWFSLALGLAQLLTPGTVTRLIGCRDTARRRAVIRAVGIREVAVGVGLLSQGHPGWLWARVLGDAIDLALLGGAWARPGTRNGRILTATAGVLGVTWLDAQRARERQLTSAKWQRRRQSPELRAVVTIGVSPEEVYRFWRDFENLPRFMSHLEAVRAQNGHSRWWAKGPAGVEIKWDAEITVDRPNELIAWQSLEGSDLPNRGAVRFRPAPGGRGTEVLVTLTFTPPGGRLGAVVAKVLGKISEQQLANDLRRLKQVLETGEIVRSDASVQRGSHPARPPSEVVDPGKQVRQ